MPRKRRQPEAADDLSFPVPFREQAWYLKLAEDFLALDGRRQNDNVIPEEHIPQERIKIFRAAPTRSLRKGGSQFQKLSDIA